MVKLSVIQLCSVPNVESNLTKIKRLLADVKPSDEITEHIVVLPECCLYFGGKDRDQLTLAQNTEASTELIAAFSELAITYNIYLVAGSIPRLSDSEEKFTNTSIIFSPEGKQIASYDKIHLFDVNVEDSEKNYLESRYTQAGKKLTVSSCAGLNVGLSVCYDLRFPELYRNLRQLNADIITVPSAFTRVTGKAHWQSLLQARAIENQVYILAAGQEGVHENGRETWGHSMIISPWGEILASIPTGEGIASAIFSFNEIHRVRKSIPVADHNQFVSELKTYE